MNILANATNTTTAILTTTPADHPLPKYVGYIGCIIGALFFGSHVMPVKKSEVGDGKIDTNKIIV